MTTAGMLGIGTVALLTVALSWIQWRLRDRSR